MGILSTILFAAAALAAVMTILSTIRVYATEFAALRAQSAHADTAQLIVWRIVETHHGQDDLQTAFEPKVRSRADGPMSQRLWESAPSLAA